MSNMIRGFVNRRAKRTPKPQPAIPSYSYHPKTPDFVVLKVYGEIPQRHPFSGWHIIMDFLEEPGWTAQRYKNELWLFSMPLYDLEGDCHDAQ